MMHSIEDTAAFSRQIQNMFTAIAPRYDFLNRLLSVGQDRHWRKKAINRLAPVPKERILDIATGTGDMALEIASRNLSVQISGFDPAGDTNFPDVFSLSGMLATLNVCQK